MFCYKCGNQLGEKARFCARCGTPVRTRATAQSQPQPQPQQKPQPQMQSQPQPQSQPKSQPQTVAPAPQPIPRVDAPKQTIKEPAIQQVKQEKKQDPKSAPSIDKPTSLKFRAPKVSGEAVLGELNKKATNTVTGAISGPGQVLTSGFKQFFSNIFSVIKKPKVIIPSILIALIYSTIWIILNILQESGNDSQFLRILSFLTCANGGMSGGFFGGLGGIIGKGVFIGGIITVVCHLIQKKGSTKRSFGETLKGSFGVSKDTLGVYFTGIGIALLFYLFLTGGATGLSCLCGIAAMIITARAALNNGFRARFISSITAKTKNASGKEGAGLMRGFTVGYAASAIIGLITGIRIIHVILAVGFLIAGSVFIVLQLAGVIKTQKVVNA